MGEDGLISEILRRLPPPTYPEYPLWCCEFGAWDGIYLSNTAKLIREENYHAVLIEPDKKRLKDLKVNFPQKSVVKIASFVNPEGATCIDSILSKTPIPVDFEFLSIDIDGMDYYILQSLKKFRPKLISVEFNPTIPNSIFFVQEKNSKIKQGSSPKALWDLAKSKGYTVVAATDVNLFLLDDKYLDPFLADLKPIEVLIPNGNDPQIIFSGYDGTILSNKLNIRLGWHGEFPLLRFQILPRFLRKFSGDYNLLQRKLFIVFFLLKRGQLFDFIIKKIKKNKSTMLVSATRCLRNLISFLKRLTEWRSERR